MIDRFLGTTRRARQDMIIARRPAEAIHAAEQAALNTSLTDDGLTWVIAAAVLGHITEHPHALVPEADHTPILARLLGDNPDDADQAARDHPGYAAALDLAASAAGLTALYGLVYGWSIVVRDFDTECEVESLRYEGSWADAEHAAKSLLTEHDIFYGEAEVLTCTGTGSSVTA
ncbi:hypothetical protein [Nocardia brasiliensis]|uniref:hypothetical protein n=1 Tax=Nocardia brasiliensis TaxID=37326 RepID=UPI0024582D5B|nr:hypothetical protein [Nocardia brasiliensis]